MRLLHRATCRLHAIITAAWLPRLLLAACLLPLGQLWLDLRQAPERVSVRSIALHLAPGGQAWLGRQTLASPQAEQAHLRISRTEAGQWQVRNIAQARAVEARHQGRDVRLRSLSLQAGQHLHVAGQDWHVAAVTPRLRLVQPGQSGGWWFDGLRAGRLAEDGQALPSQTSCPEAGIADGLRGLWNRLAPRSAQLPAPLLWGGHAACGTRMPQAPLPPGALQVERGRDGDYVLHANAEASRLICLPAQQTTPCQADDFLSERAWPLQEIERLIVGRTHYGVAIEGDTLRLHTLWRGQWLYLAHAQGQQQAAHAAGLAWHLDTENPWRWPSKAVAPVRLAGIALGLGVLLLAGLAVLRGGATGMRPSLASALPAAGLIWSLAGLLASVAGLWLGGRAVGPAWYLALAAMGFASLSLAPVRQPGACWFLAVTAALMATGITTQFMLGLGAPDTGGWRHFAKFSSACAATLFFWAARAWWLALRTRRRQPLPWMPCRQPGGSTRWQQGVTWAYAVACMGLLCVQLVAGSEEGVLGIQPVEFAKFALLICAAQVLALWLERQQAMQHTAAGKGVCWPLAASVLLTLGLGAMLVLAALPLLALRDFSPLALLAALLWGLLLAMTVGSGRWLGLALACALAGLLAWGLQWAQGDDGLRFLTERGLYAARLMVWLDPLHHPHSGEQLLKASQLIAQGGWTGLPSAQGWGVPAIQSDFTPAFLMARYGMRAALSLLAAQTVWVLLLLLLGWQSLCQSQCVQDYGLAWRKRRRFFMCWGMAALLAAQIAISWSTNLGWLPVMGQPMPLLASGGSLLVGLLAPFGAFLIFTGNKAVARPLPGSSSTQGGHIHAVS
ncbi:hypothetical protein CK623_04380 [Vandammella animalimorsus]|uniref:Uncharacterized protein n=1 Tax=Vandammella animalimorsus TaxID=2029117 RepID=A0A2A2ASJ2_9BURK|nr:FtsW/RodA/SpoVE family cell cycle protein [Vandammella animalimorsus]PAT40619.1 hypothetical protein CK623_04380 [Vandammella animalimorsus]